MVVALCIVLQTRAISYSIRRLYTGWVRRVENVFECMILAALFLLVTLLAQMQYALTSGFLESSDYGPARQLVFLLITVLGTTVAVELERSGPFFAIGGAAILLPMAEAVTGFAYPFFFFLSILFFLIRSMYICLIRHRELRTQITAISVKEAIDNLRTGLLLFRQEGDVLLCNCRMEELALQMTGHSFGNGKEFLKLLEEDTLSGGCTWEVFGGQKVLRLPDCSVWSITSHEIPRRRKRLILLIADDITERWNAVTYLARQNQELEKRGQELRHTIENLQAICEAEEIARSKGRVHDLLGQRISLLLRILRDDRKMDQRMLMEFIRNLPTALREERMSDPARQLEMLKETFQGMEVSVEIRGELPEDEEVADCFTKIAVECATNAVRHGYATCIQLHFFQNDCWRMTVTDNGIPPAGPVREGGGISEMRRRIQRLGGTLELHIVPRFIIQIYVPKEAERK